MSEIQPLDHIIQKTESDTVPAKHLAAAEFIRYDTKKKKLLNPKAGIFEFTNRNVNKYLVFSGIKSKGVVQNCIINTLSHSLDLDVYYQVECIKGLENKVVEKLHVEERPTEAFNKIINKWVAEDYIREKTEGPHEFIVNYYTYEKPFLTYLKRRAAEELGLRMEVEFRPRGEPDQEQISHSFSVEAVVPDYHRDVLITVTVKIVRDETNKELALINSVSEDEIKKMTQRSVTEIMVNHSSLHELLYEKQLVSSKCQANLAVLLKGIGRRCIHFSYERVDETPLPAERFQREYPPKESANDNPEDIKKYTYRIKDSSEFRIDNSIRLTLVDIGAYFRAEVSSLEEKVEEIITDVVQDVVYSKYYVDLITDFDVCEEEIMRRVTERCKAIGYSVTQHVVLADQKIMEIARNGFDIEIPFKKVTIHRENKEGEVVEEREVTERFGTYATRDANVLFNLGAVVRGSLSDIRKLRHYIKPNSDFELTLAETIDSEIRRILHTKDPHQVYMEFYDADESTGAERIEEVLLKGIRTRLERDFYAQGVSIILKPLASPLIDRLKKLRGETRKFFMSITSFRETGRLEDVEYEIHFSIKGIVKDGWYIFQSRHFEDGVEEEIKAIQNLLISEIQSKMSLAEKERLRYTDFSNMDDVQRLMQTSTSVIANNFGLEVQLGPIRRLSTKLEREIQASLGDVTRKRIQAHTKLDGERIEALTKQLMDITKQIHDKQLKGGDLDNEEEIEDLRNSEKQILNELAAYEDQSFSNQMPGEQSPGASVFGLLDKKASSEPEGKQDKNG